MANNTTYGKGYRIRGDQEPGFEYTLTLRRLREVKLGIIVSVG